MNTRSHTRLQKRSFIEKLPVEMQLEIFNYLDPWSIRRCSETCTTFFHLTLRPQFKKHFGLVMSVTYLASDCGIGEIFAAGNRTKRTFDSLILQSTNFKLVSFAKNFFMRLGREINELCITQSFLAPVMMAKETSVIEINLRRNILMNFPNLKKLVVDSDKTLVTLQYFPPSLKEVLVDDVIYGHSNKSTNYADYLIRQHGASQLQKLTFSNLAFVCHCLKDDPSNKSRLSDDVYNIIEEIGTLHHVNIIKTDCNLVDHTRITPACVTGINFQFIPSISFNALKFFPNLEILELSIDREVFQNCFTDHNEPFPDLSHIKILKLVINSGYICDSCVSKVLTSFTGLTSLVFEGTLTEECFRLIVQHMPKLESLKITGPLYEHFFDSAEYTANSLEQLRNLQALIISDSPGLEYTLTNASLLKFSHLPNLKYFALVASCTFQLDGIRNMVLNCPKLSTFHTTAPIDLQMAQEMLQNWPRLDLLSLPNSMPFCPATWQSMKEHSRFLQNLIVSPDQPLLTFSEECSLFENLPSLKRILKGNRHITRSEYYERDIYLERNGHRYEELSLKRKREEEPKKTSNKRRRLTYNYSSAMAAFEQQLREALEDYSHQQDTEDDDDEDDDDEDDDEDDEQPNGCAIA